MAKSNFEKKQLPAAFENARSSRRERARQWSNMTRSGCDGDFHSSNNCIGRGLAKELETSH